MPYSLCEGTFSTRDHLKLHYRFLELPGAVDTLIMLHGHGEHSGRYLKFSAYLEDKGYNLAIYDARGHGLSEGRLTYVNCYDDFTEDLSCFAEFLEHKHRLSRRFSLLGHSNGALIAAHWALKHQERLKALFLSSPYFGLRLPGFLIGFNECLNRFHPGFVYKNPVYPPYLTHNLEELETYKKDKLIRRQITSRLLSEMIRAFKKLQSLSEVRVPFPVYILMSGAERVVDPEKTRDFYQKLRAPDKDICEFSGLYHEIFNELGQEKVFEKLREFVDRAQKIRA